MNNYSRYFLITFLICLLFFSFTKPVVAENSNIVLEFFISSSYCDSCEEKKPIINEIESFYGDNITIISYEVDTTTNIDNYNKFKSYGFKTYPAVVVKNITADEKYNVLLPYEDITFENIKNAVDYHLTGNYSYKQPELNENEICFPTPFGQICFNASETSLVIITILIAAIDSVNPCSFFVLLFLLSILLYTKSKKKMILVGGIFIFFSGFFYFLLMAALLNFVSIVENTYIISIIAGIIAVIFGFLNIKDFFFFKKGLSIGVTDIQKSKLYVQIRKIIKITSVPSLIFSTIVLAISANSVELLCTFNLPFIYTGTILPQYNLGIVDNYLYLIFYNIIYVLPLLIIVGIMVITLGRWKLSEFQGRVLKLFSGIMILSLGIILLIDYKLLENVFSVIYLLIISALITLILSIICKRNKLVEKI
jgi:thiol-disulfide isomerase/thioredoxin